MRAPRPALIGGIALTIAITPVLAATTLAADPTVVVQPGDTLTAIGRRHGVSVSRLVELNDLDNPNRIFAGQRLRVGRDRSRPARPVAATRQGRVVHVVTAGSTLSHVAVRYGVSVSAIVAANRIANPSLIFAGQRLVIPPTDARAKPAARAASPPRMSASMAQLVARRSWMRGVLVREADRHGVPRSLVLAVAWQESGWQQKVVSHAGAVGVMQLMPGTAEWIGEAMLGRRVRIHQARDNIHAGVRLLRHYLDRYDGDVDLVLAAYYQGQRAVDTHGVYRVSRPYIASIRSLKRLFGG